MKVTLESTSKIVELQKDGQRLPARVWEGHTDTGIAVHAFVTRIAVDKSVDASQFERELIECRPPSRLVDESYPLRIVL